MVFQLRGFVLNRRSGTLAGFAKRDQQALVFTIQTKIQKQYYGDSNVYIGVTCSKQSQKVN